MYKNELVLNPVGGGPPRNPKKEVVGRDIFVEQMIERLEYTSIQMFAPRRLGKSWVLKLLEVKAPSSVMAVYMDLEGSHSTYEFVENVATAFNFAGKRLGAAVGKILEDFSIGHLKAVGHKFPWKEHLDGIFQKLPSNLPLYQTGIRQLNFVQKDLLPEIRIPNWKLQMLAYSIHQLYS